MPKTEKMSSGFLRGFLPEKRTLNGAFHPFALFVRIDVKPLFPHQTESQHHKLSPAREFDCSLVGLIRLFYYYIRN
jgi:hypothetical protein